MIKKFWERGVSFLRFNTDDYPRTNKITFNLDTKKEDILFYFNKQSITNKDILSVWLRRPLSPGISKEITNPDARVFAKDESKAFLENLWNVLDCLWVSPPRSIKIAQYKLLQLQIAKKIGFKVPKTIVTNKIEDFLRFWNECNGEVIYKTLGKNQIPSQKKKGMYRLIYTNKIKDVDLNKIIEEIELAPCLFQEYIPKKIELRVTIVDSEIFTCEIHSQKSEKTRIDWRKYDFENTPHIASKLPKDIEEKCIELIDFYNLKFGAIDLILTPQDEYVFLELNPNGQWLWIEQLTGLPISEALFRLLTKEVKI